MSNSRYSTIRPSTVLPSDIEILYSYTPNRETPPNYILGKLEPASQYLTPYYTQPNSIELLGGLYNLTLPSSVFNQLGIYTIIIRPKQIRTKIVDCGVLSALPNEKGIVFDLNGSVDNSGNSIDLTNLVNNLSGYRIEYLNDNGNGKLSLKENYFTIVTNANKAEVVSSNVNNSTQKATTYRLTDNGKLIYVSVSPQAVNTVKPNVKPFIGEPGQSIILTNTNFNPIIMEVEMVEYTENEIGIGIFGSQTRNVQNGVVSYYRPDLSIYKQSLMYGIKDEFNNPLYEIKQDKTQIDASEDFKTITSGVQ